MRVSSAAEGRVHDLLGRGLDLGEVLGALEGLRVDLVDVLGAGGTRREPRRYGKGSSPPWRNRDAF